MSYPSTPNYGRSAVFGGVLIVVGLALIVVAAVMSGESPMFLIGGLVLASGVLRLTTALSSDARRRRLHPVDPDDPRWRDDEGVVQLAGRTCVECGRRIIIGAEGRLCSSCESPTHVDCAMAHRSHAHGGRPVLRSVR